MCIWFTHSAWVCKFRSELWWIVSTDLSDIWKEFWLSNEIVEEVSEGSLDPLNQNLRPSPEKITLPMGFNIKGKLYWRFNKTTLTFSFHFSLIWIGHFEELHLEIMFGEISPNRRPTFWGLGTSMPAWVVLMRLLAGRHSFISPKAIFEISHLHCAGILQNSIQPHGIDLIIDHCTNYSQNEKFSQITRPDGLIDKKPCSNAT